MSAFSYEISNAEGETKRGILEANNLELAVSQLKEMGGYLISVKEKPKQIASLFSRAIPLPWGNKIKPKDIVVFNRQLAAMIGAGLSLVNCLSVLSTQTENQKLSRTMKKVVAEINAGASFSDALAKFPQVFSRLYVSMVRAGETSGTVEQILNRLAVFLEKSEAIRQQIKSATIYPKLLISVALLGAGFIFSYVLPKFVAMFAELGATLPLPTRILIALVNFIVGNKMLLLGIVLGLPAILIGYGKTFNGRFNYHKLQLKLPIIGKVVKKVVISRTCHTLGILYSSGIPILEALKIVQDVANNLVVEKILNQARQEVEEGKSIAEAISENQVFPPMVIYMMRVGEETGKMDDMLAKISEYYDEEVENTVKKLSSILEPLLICVMALIIGFIVVSIFFPMVDMIDAIKVG